MHISLKSDNSIFLKTFIHKYKALSARERMVIVGLFAAAMVAVAMVAFGVYLSAGSTDPVQEMPNKVVAQPVKKQPVVNSNKPMEEEISYNTVLDDTASLANPFLPPPQYRVKPDSTQPQPESKVANVNLNPAIDYKLPMNIQIPERKPQPAARPVLQGIVQGAGQYKAVISYQKNSAAYVVNDFIGFYQVTDITNDAVILEGSEGRLVLTLKK